MDEVTRTPPSPGNTAPGELKRSLTLPWVVLYGLGVTVGAGIYVLLGAAVATAGVHAPMSFIVAAVVMIFSAATFAELAGRFPVSAGEAAYVRAGFGRAWLSGLVGFMVIFLGVVSSAAITVGSTGYIQEFLDVPDMPLIVGIVAALGAVAAWGIKESVIAAGLFTLVEVGGLLAIVGFGLASNPDVITEVPAVFPPITDVAAWTGVAGAGLLAFFAFIGFEDMVNLAEEVKQPRRTMPWAIFLTLVVTTVIYFAVTVVAVLTVPLDALGESRAPLSDIFRHVTGAPAGAITAIAIVATLNGVIIQMIMASRVVYGLAKQGTLPARLAVVHPRTRTPLVATGIVAAAVLALALAFPIGALAETTSRVSLVVFALVNLALLMVKRRDGPVPAGQFEVWSWVPGAGLLTCLALLATDMVG